MKNTYKHTPYPLLEERINVASHGIGLMMSVVALLVLLQKTDGLLQTISVTVFAASLIALYASSTIYHSTANPARRFAMRTVDHAMIYVLIAGTYTPFSLLVLGGTVGWAVLATIWSMAAVGIVLKCFYTGRFDRLSTAMYVLMGWTIVVAIKPLFAGLSVAGLIWLFAGGISYTVGALFYSIKSMPFGHATFHLFVLLGSVCHFICVYGFVI